MGSRVEGAGTLSSLCRDFCLPYVNELSEEFGGVMIHSCGNFSHQLDNLAQVRDLRAHFGHREQLDR